MLKKVFNLQNFDADVLREGRFVSHGDPYKRRLYINIQKYCVYLPPIMAETHDPTLAEPLYGNPDCHIHPIKLS